MKVNKGRGGRVDGNVNAAASPPTPTPPGQPPKSPVVRTTALWDDDALLNPFRESLEVGREIGRVDGEASGYADGLQAGRLTGIEHGMEVGFFRGVVQAIQENLLDNRLEEGQASTVHDRRSRIRHPDRIRKTLRDLEALLEEFPMGAAEPPAAAVNPAPHAAASQSISDHNEARTTGSAPPLNPEVPSLGDNDNDTTEYDNDTDEDLPTATEALQRIRAQSKLLAAQLGVSHRTLSLAAVMEDGGRGAVGASATDRGGRVGSEGGTDPPSTPSQLSIALDNAAAIAEW